MNANGSTLPDPASMPAWMWAACDSMMIIDEHRRIRAINPAMEQLLGVRAVDVVGQQECGVLLRCRALEGYALTRCAEDCPGLQAMSQKKAVRVTEYTIQTGSGRRAAMSASYTPFRPHPEAPVWALVVLREVTRQKRIEQRWRRQALADPLTGLANRAHFLETLQRELRRAVRHSRELAVLIVDVDGLKTYNDRHGHLAGDEVLKAVARALQQERRGEELVARFGGDEFMVLLPETTEAGAMVVAERLRRAVAEARWPQHSTPMTVSIGIATFPLEGHTVAALLAVADRRLYEAKRAGRNRLAAGETVLERRAQPRVPVSTLMHLTPAATPAASAYTGTLNNVSLKGLHCTVPKGVPAAVGDLFHVALEIPPAGQSLFPLSHLEGIARVVRVEANAAHPVPALAATLDVALAFERQLRMQAAWAHQGGALPGAASL